MKNYDAAVKAYLENMRNNELSAASVESYSRTFRYFRDSMEKHGYKDVCPKAVMSFKSDLDVSIVTLNLYLSHLRQLSGFAARYGFCEPFLFDDAMPPKNKVSKARKKPYAHVLNLEQIKALISAEKPLHGNKPHTWLREQAEVTLMLLSGARNSELRALELADLDWENNVMHLRVTKGDKPRMVPFTPAAQKAVRAYLAAPLRPADAEGPLFGCLSRTTGQWKPLSRTQLSDLIHNYTRSVLGEEYACRTHAQRHAFASASLEMGLAIDKISSVLGHADTATTAIYAQRLDPAKSAAEYGFALDAALA